MEVSGQVQTFLLMVGTGFVLGALMDVYRSLLRHWRLRALPLCLFDLVYGLLNATFVFGILLLGNWGEVRFYVFIGLLSGAALYYFWLYEYLRRLLWYATCQNNSKSKWLFWCRK